MTIDGWDHVECSSEPVQAEVWLASWNAEVENSFGFNEPAKFGKQRAILLNMLEDVNGHHAAER